MSFKGWEKISLQTGTGLASAIAPVIISASRSTDIPAWHSAWFINRLKQGYCQWINPFNRQPQYVSFAKTRAIVFWTKNPAPLLLRLPLIDQTGVGYYFHFTVNDYEQENLEPGLPSLADRIATFAGLSEKLGKERVIWRFDPLLLSDTLTPATLLARLSYIGDKIHTLTAKLVISFADLNTYAKVRRRLGQTGGNLREFTAEEILETAAGLQKLNRRWGLQIATCGEPYDLSSYGITQNKCIDDALLKRLFPADHGLMEFLRKTSKDHGQRSHCHCIASKDIGQYDTCLYSCLYCYANSGNKNFRPGPPYGESIIT